MDNIIEPNESFDFSKLSLAHPVGIQGGAYFTKIEFNKKPLYIQTSKSLTRQGFVKTGKKYYCDLMFDKNSETIIHWLENLEEKCHKLIYEKKDAWFQGNLEENDIVEQLRQIEEQENINNTEQYDININQKGIDVVGGDGDIPQTIIKDFLKKHSLYELVSKYPKFSDWPTHEEYKNCHDARKEFEYAYLSND